ncbi:MAG: hypothetical protein K0S47_3949 [Herbinix sp.]|jgi:hypothetical protein|nr:hypothetical protein [Herbinix sp.]
MKNIDKLLLSVLVLSILLTFLPKTAYANSAEPPSVVILVNNPPEDLSIELETDKSMINANVRQVAWEGYYSFYTRDIKTSSKFTFKITTKGESFTCTIDKPIQRYKNIYTLDLTSRELTSGTHPLRSVLLVSIRLLLTLVLEGLIFWLFGFRDKRSWFVFLIINLVTQGSLNIWLGIEASLMSSYLIFALIIGEFFVFVAEMIAFPIFIDEFGKTHTVVYAFVGNLISLIAGGYIISLLPV